MLHDSSRELILGQGLAPMLACEKATSFQVFDGMETAAQPIAAILDFNEGGAATTAGDVMHQEGQEVIEGEVFAVLANGADKAVKHLTFLGYTKVSTATCHGCGPC